MPHDPRLLDALEALEPLEWSGVVFRYTAGKRPPSHENTHGARWNPPAVPTIYTTLERDTALAEFSHHLAVLSPRPTRGTFTLYRIRTRVEKVLDLRARSVLTTLGLDPASLGRDDFAPTQAVGGAVAWLERGGILVPSARHPGTNLVLFTAAQDPDFPFEVEAEEPLTL
jgi:RES domain-containing protein